MILRAEFFIDDFSEVAKRILDARGEGQFLHRHSVDLEFFGEKILELFHRHVAVQRAGVADVKVKTVVRRRCNTVCDSDTSRNDDTSLAFGAALGLRTRYNIGLSLQYMQYVDKDYITVTGVEGGLEWYF